MHVYAGKICHRHMDSDHMFLQYWMFFVMFLGYKFIERPM